MKRTQIALAALGVLLTMLNLSAANVGVIKGSMKDAGTGEPLAGVNVIVEGTTIGTATDVDGDFIIRNVPVGRCKVVASMIGYAPVTNRVVVGADKPVDVDFRLRQSAISMGAVVVTGTRTPRFIADVPVRTEVITSEAIQDKAAPDLYEALDGSAGIRVEQQCLYCNFSMLRMQGLGADHTQILVDGQPVYSGLAGVYGLQQLSTAEVERIEVTKGAGSALYGSSAIAGAINVITKRPTHEPSISLGVEMGSYNTNRYHFNASARKNCLGVTLFAQRHGGAIIDQTADGLSMAEVKNPDGISDRVETNVTNVGFSVVVDTIIGQDQLTIRGKTLHEFRLGGVLDDDLYENPFSAGTERIITDRYEGETGYLKRFSFGSEINGTFAYVHHNRNATNDTYLGDYMATHADTMPNLEEMRPYMAAENLYTANLNYLQPLGMARLLLGLQYSHNDLTESGKYVVVDEDDPLYGESYTSTSEKKADEFGAYLQGEFEIADPLEIVAGVRYDYHQSEDNFRGSGNVHPEGLDPLTYQESSVNPRLAIKYSPFEFLTLRTSAGTGFKVPYGFSEDLHLCSGSPRVWKGADLEPEKSISYNLSTDVNFDRFIFNLNLYRTNLKNAVGLVDASEQASALGYTYEWQNVDNAYVQGIELGASVSILSFLGVSADFAINDGQYANVREDWVGTEYEDASRYIPRFPLNTGSASINFDPGDWDLTLGANYQGPMYIDYFADGEEPTQIKKTEPHVLFNARLARGLFKNRLNLYAGGKNLTDYVQPEKHSDDAAFMYAPMYGRILYAGVEVSF